MMSNYHLAQINIALLRAPINDPMIEGFVNGLDAMNALAEQTDGFVWRLQTEDGDATALRVFDNELIIVNMSVWESIEALYAYTHQTKHVEFFRQRRDWFERMTTPHLAMWWIESGSIPTVENGKFALQHLEQHGPTPRAFTFKQRFSVADWLAFQEEHA